jgi:hypothetical protein
MPEEGGVLVFDLHAESASLAKRTKTLRQVMLFLTALSSVFVAWFVIIALTQGVAGFQWVVLAVVLSCFSLLIGLFLLVIWKTRPGAVGLKVKAGGLEFEWPSGKVELLPWGRIDRGFMLEDYSVTEFSRDHPQGNWSIRRWRRPVTCLSKEAFDAIIHAGSARGLTVNERVTRTGPIRWLPSRIVRFSSMRAK